MRAEHEESVEEGFSSQRPALFFLVSFVFFKFKKTPRKKEELHFIVTCKSSSFYHRGVLLSVGTHWGS